MYFTEEGSLKARNMERDARVAIPITDHDDLYATAQLRGVVKEVRGAEEAHALSDTLALRYTASRSLQAADLAPVRARGPQGPVDPAAVRAQAVA